MKQLLNVKLHLMRNGSILSALSKHHHQPQRDLREHSRKVSIMHFVHIVIIRIITFLQGKLM